MGSIADKLTITYVNHHQIICTVHKRKIRKTERTAIQLCIIMHRHVKQSGSQIVPKSTH